MKGILAIVVLGAVMLCVCSGAFGALVTPHVAHGSINLKPYGSVAAHDVLFWKNKAYVSGAATSGAGPTVWSVDVSNPDSLVYLGGAGSGYKAYEIKMLDDILYAANWATVFRSYSTLGGLSMLGEWDGGSELFGWKIDIWNGRAFIGQGNETQSTIHIMDITDPAYPSVVSSIPLYKIGALAARGSYLYYTTDDTTFQIANISDENNPHVVASVNMGHQLLGGVRLRDNYAYLYWSEVTDGGLYIFDVSDPTNPSLVGTYTGPLACDFYMMGDYAFYPTSGNGFMTIDISNPANPYAVEQSDVPFYALELCLAGNGKQLYVGSLAGDNEGWLTVFDVFDADPDSAGPGSWKSFWPAQTSHTLQYFGDAMPASASPAWTLLEGSESRASVQPDGTLRVNDTGTVSGDKVKWIRNWNGTNTHGTTTMVRAKCASYNLNGSTIPNIIIEDGKYREEVAILSDRVKTNTSGAQYLLDGTQWHTYRITTSGTQLKVYVDEAATPVITTTLSSTTERSRICFGSGSSAATQDIYFDYAYCFDDGSRGPAGTSTDTTPDITVDVADTAGKGSLSGINPSTATVQWSTDGGYSWKSSGFDCKYEGDALPASSASAWTVAEGSQSYASIVSGTVRVNDNSTAGGSKVKWSRDWRVSPAIGTTVLARVRCVSTGGDTTYMGNIFIEDGSRAEMFKVYADRIVATNANQTYYLDATQWHTYRITTRGTSFALYVDENATPVMTGSLDTAATTNRIMFGSGASAATQDIYFDYVYYSGAGAFAPGAPAVTVTCSGVAGDDRGTMNAYAVPFNQYSETLNQVRFSLLDIAGNRGLSPAYTIRVVSPGAPGPVSSFVATAGDGLIDLTWTNPSSAQFTGTVIRFKTTGFPTGPADGTLVVDKSNTPGSNDNEQHSGLTNGVTYYYSAYSHDSVPNYAAGANASATPADTTAPGNVTSFAATSGDTQNSLSWSNPGDADFAGVKVMFKTTGYPTSATDGTQCYSGIGTSYPHTGLTNGVTYYYSAFAFDEVPNYAAKADASAVPADVTAPGPVTSFVATPGNGQNSLAWTNPGASDFAGTRIVFKTTGYPTSPSDGAECYTGTGTSYPHTGLTNGVAYYYSAFAFDEVPNYSTKADASGTPFSSTCILNVKTAGGITIDGSSADWALGDFTTYTRGGQGQTGDIAEVGYDGGTVYRGSYVDSLPTSAADHQAKVYSRHDSSYQYFLVRCEDSDMQFGSPAGSNWANDCVEFYIDPSHDHGSSSMSDSTSDIQLVIDANNQKNVYMCTSGYATQVLNGVTFAVVRDGTGWWCEVRIQKSALDPDMPNNGTFGVDFNFRDNDNNNDPALTTVYTWNDPSGQGFPSKIPGNWGDASLAALPGVPDAPAVTAPANGATVTTLTPTITWTGDAHAAYQVRVSLQNDSNTSTGGWDSGEVISGSDSCASGTLRNWSFYYVFVRLRNAGGWGGWSAAGRNFVVSTDTVNGTVYLGDAMPTTKLWQVYDTGSYENGGSITSTIVSDGGYSNVWQMRDNSTVNRCKEKYSNGMNIDFTTGATVAARVKATSVTGTPTYCLGISNGNVGGMFLRILTNSVVLVDINGTNRGSYSVSTNAYHKYQLTVKNSTPGDNNTAVWKVYVDGTQRITWTGAGVHNGFDGLMAGQAGTGAKGYWWFGYIAGRADGEFTPAQWDPVY